LKTEYPANPLKDALHTAGVKPTVRAEALSLEKTAAIYRALASKNGDLSATGK
jgi:hypothetical protein